MLAFTESKINSLGYTDFTEWTNYLPSLCPFIPDSPLAMQLKSGRLFLLYGNALAVMSIHDIAFSERGSNSAEAVIKS